MGSNVTGAWGMGAGFNGDGAQSVSRTPAQAAAVATVLLFKG